MKDRLTQRRREWGWLAAAATVAVPLVPVGARSALAQACQQGSVTTQLVSGATMLSSHGPAGVQSRIRRSMARWPFLAPV